MAAKMMLKEVKAPLIFLRRSALAFSRSKTATSSGELAQRPLAQPEVAVLLRRYLYRGYSSKAGIPGLMNSGFGMEARGSKRVDDTDDCDDSDSDCDYSKDNYDASGPDWSD